MRRKKTVQNVRLVALALLASALSACSTVEPGTATPATSNPAAPSSTAGSAPAGSGLADLELCADFERVAGRFPLVEIKKQEPESCVGKYDLGDGNRITVGMNAFPTLGLSKAVPGPDSEVSNITIAGRAALLDRKPAGATSCAVRVEVSETARVDFVGVYHASLDQACDAATALANAITPTLPTE
ncbi:hypothetical protein [Actinosynnema sp.]|uniref:hypothetical protein n=1 Tax=Actinosynnema sp. TaxID=1872144 RepID=UPI003F8377D6